MFAHCVLPSESNCNSPPQMAGMGDSECLWDEAGSSGNGNGDSVGKGCVIWDPRKFFQPHKTIPWNQRFLFRKQNNLEKSLKEKKLRKLCSPDLKMKKPLGLSLRKDG